MSDADMQNATKMLEVLDASIADARDLGREALPAGLVNTVAALKIADSLLQSLGAIERADFESLLRTNEARASAFAVSAIIYGDLSDLGYDALIKHIRARTEARLWALQGLGGVAQ
jgi:hypothetical protein